MGGSCSPSLASLIHLRIVTKGDEGRALLSSPGIGRNGTKRNPFPHRSYLLENINNIIRLEYLRCFHMLLRKQTQGMEMSGEVTAGACDLKQDGQGRGP